MTPVAEVRAELEALAGRREPEAEQARRATLRRTLRLEAEGLAALEAALAGPLGERVLAADDALVLSGSPDDLARAEARLLRG